MEYEQLENGNKVIHQAIEHQDVAAYFDMVSPHAVLITHFPYPDYGNPNVAAATAISPASIGQRNKVDPHKKKRQLLKEQREQRDAQKQRYNDFLVKRAKKAAAPKTEDGEEEDNQDDTNNAAAAVPPPPPEVTVTEPPVEARGRKSQQGSGYGSLRRSQSGRSGSMGTASRREGATATVDGIAFYFSQPPPVESAVLEGVPTEDSPPPADGDAQAERKAAPPAGLGDPATREDVRANYGKYVDIAEGRVLVVERMGFLLNWLAHGDYIAEVTAQFEPRKGILQDAEVLPPPPPPASQQEEYALLGPQLTDRNQRLSRLTVVWGREFLLFADQCYFDDGFIVTIHRRLLTLTEMLHMLPTTAAHAQRLTVSQRADRIRQELANFYGVTKSRVAAVSHAWPLLDFSFRNIRDAAHLLRATPSSGKLHAPSGVRPLEDPSAAQGVFLNADNDPTRAKVGSRTLIKAKNKHGEEEAYEFEHGHQRYQIEEQVNDDSADGLERMLKEGTGSGYNKYDASCVRVSSCHLSRRMDKFVLALRAVVANVFVTVSVLDLSDNEISELPDFTRLPLQKLLLHGNCISEWAEVEEKVCPLPSLQSVTLHGNPISDENPKYWQFALSRLITNPNRQVKLKQLDFVTLTAQDYSMASAYDKFTPSAQKPIRRSN